MESHTGPGRFTFYGANHPDVIEEVHAGRIDVSTLNPAAMLTMAHRGTGAFDGPQNVAAIAVLPHYDQLGFAVATRLGFTALTTSPLSATRCASRCAARSTRARPSWSTSCCAPTGSPWPTSWRGAARSATTSRCPTTRPGWGAWRPGKSTPSSTRASSCGPTSWPAPAPASCRSSTWTSCRPRDSAAGCWRSRCIPSLPGDIETVDYSGWPIYCRADAPAALIEKFCHALITRQDAIVWDIGGPRQPPLPLDRMARESPSTPQDVPLHPAAAAVWHAHGYL